MTKPPPFRRRLGAVLRPRANRAQLVVGLLCAVFGFALVVQVRTARPDGGRGPARGEDLARILDDLGARSDRLRGEIDALRATRDRLANGTDRSRVALVETRRRAEQLGILAGTVAASGPGVVITMEDPRAKIRADVLLDAVEELRDAGAEALQIDGSSGTSVRIVASSALLDVAGGGVAVDGTRLRPPYRLVAIGESDTLAAALRIPGGVVDTVAARDGAQASVAAVPTVTVATLHRLSPPRYAFPTPTASAG